MFIIPSFWVRKGLFIYCLCLLEIKPSCFEMDLSVLKGRNWLVSSLENGLISAIDFLLVFVEKISLSESMPSFELQILRTGELWNEEPSIAITSSSVILSSAAITRVTISRGKRPILFLSIVSKSDLK